MNMENELKAIRTLTGQLLPLVEGLDPTVRRALGITLPAERELLTALERLHDAGHSALTEKETKAYDIRKEIRTVELQLGQLGHDQVTYWEMCAARDAFPTDEWGIQNKARCEQSLKDYHHQKAEYQKELERLQRALAKLEA
jgi:hypothetical protein